MEQTDRLLLRSSPSEDTSPEMGVLLGHALALDNKRVVIGMDLMRSSPMMKSALIAGLLGSGVDVIDVGVVSGPTLAMSACKGDCAVYVTEFRDPDLVSGYLLFNRDGSLFRKDQIRHLERIFVEKPEMPDFNGIGTVKAVYDATYQYIKKVMSLLDGSTGGSIVLNCNCGTASDQAPQILNSIGTDMISINAQRDRNFAANSLSTNEANIRHMKAIIQANAGSIGITLNRIGTLMRAFDEEGDPISDENVLALFILYLRPKKVVVPMNITKFIEDVLTSKLDIEMVTPHPPQDEVEFIISANDAATVCSLVEEHSADIGYYDGGFIFRNMSMMSDAVFASAVLAQISGNNSLRGIIETFPEYYREDKQYKFQCTKDEFVRILNENIPSLNPVRVISDSGWRVDLDGGWMSILFDDAAEDAVNVTMESDDKAYLVGLMELVDDLMQRCVNGQ